MVFYQTQYGISGTSKMIFCGLPVRVFLLGLCVRVSLQSDEVFPTYLPVNLTHKCSRCPLGYFSHESNKDCIFKNDTTSQPLRPVCQLCLERQHSTEGCVTCEKNHIPMHNGCACPKDKIEDFGGFCVRAITIARHEQQQLILKTELLEECKESALPPSTPEMKMVPSPAGIRATVPSSTYVTNAVSSPANASTYPACNPCQNNGMICVSHGIFVLILVIGVFFGMVMLSVCQRIFPILRRKADSAKQSLKERRLQSQSPSQGCEDSPTSSLIPLPRESSIQATDERPSRPGSPNQPSTGRQPNENDSQRNSREDADIPDVVTFRRTPPVTVPVGNLVEPTTPVDQQNLQNDERSSQQGSPNQPPTRRQPNENDSHRNSREEANIPQSLPVSVPADNPAEMTTPEDQENLQNDGTALRNSHGDKEARVRDDHPLRNGNVEDSEKQLDDGLRILENSVINEAEADYILRNSLRLRASECQKIANKKNTPAEMIREGYNLWRQQQGSRADIHALIAALRRCERHYTADKIVQECGIEERKGNQTVKEYLLELAIRSCEKIVVDDKIIEFFRSNLRLGDQEMEELLRDRKTFPRKGLLKWVEKNTKENATAKKLIGHFLSADMKNLAHNIIDDIRKEYPHYVYRMDSGNVSLQEEPRGTDLKAGPIASSATGTEAEYSLPELAAGSTSRYSTSGHGSPNSERSSRQLHSDGQSEGSVSRHQPSSSTSASNTRTGTTREEPESSPLTLPKATQNTTVDEILRAKEDPNNDVTCEDWDNISDYPYEDGKSANRVLATTPSSNGSLNMNNSETRHKEPIAVSMPKKSKQMSLNSSSSCHKEQKK